MLAPSHRLTLGLAISLSLAMWATRGQHFASLTHLPDASWAIFILVGYYFRRSAWLPVFLTQAVVIDCLAVTQDGVSNYCITPAYIFLLPAYAVLWLTGRWYSRSFRMNVRSLPALALYAISGSLLCELVSSGSFYFLGGRFSGTSLAEFGSRLIKYFPPDLGGVAVYLGCAVLVHSTLSIIHGSSARGINNAS